MKLDEILLSIRFKFKILIMKTIIDFCAIVKNSLITNNGWVQGQSGTSSIFKGTKQINFNRDDNTISLFNNKLYINTYSLNTEDPLVMYFLYN